jgi:hypothetical protein
MATFNLYWNFVKNDSEDGVRLRWIDPSQREAAQCTVEAVWEMNTARHKATNNLLNASLKCSAHSHLQKLANEKKLLIEKGLTGDCCFSGDAATKWCWKFVLSEPGKSFTTRSDVGEVVLHFWLLLRWDEYCRKSTKEIDIEYQRFNYMLHTLHRTAETSSNACGTCV